MVPKRIFGLKMDEVTWKWRKLHNEELNDLYYTPNIFRVIKSRRMRLAGHVARIWRGEIYTGFWWRNLRRRDHLKYQGVDARIIVRWIFRRWDVGIWTGSSWLSIATGSGTCECGNEPSGSIKCGELLASQEGLCCVA
jgi:hypothetical protein